jgi:hypothetical protein
MYFVGCGLDESNENFPIAVGQGAIVGARVAVLRKKSCLQSHFERGSGS